ncbi:NAD-dependent epimerase/dehydratase family protein [Qipengyuania sp. ASV99]|uniref:NAD-dependent epimerase/dehydratase family protein n=1 Tax=Qipengyuania sp. ASV99 TaxID=3399681 RepID=UPI003A4C5F60
MTSAARLAITGATGFVGSAVIDAALGHDLQLLARRKQAPRKGAVWVQGTLGDEEALDALCRGVDAVIHIAGLTNTPDPAEFEAANVTGTANMIGAAKRAGVRRFVFVSSLAAREPQLSAYGASKARAETLVEASGLDWTIVRPPGVYGPRDDDYLEMFRTAKHGFVPLPPGGASSIIHVDDLARLLVTLAETGGHKSIYEPDDGREGGWSHKELAQAIGRAVGRRSVFAPHLPQWALGLAAGADRLLRGDRAKLTADRVGYMCHPNWVARSDRRVPPGLWQPQISGEEGLKSAAEWYRAQGWL